MNLLFVIKTLESAGGAERILAQITADMAERGHSVTVLSFDATGSNDFYVIDPRISRIWLDSGRAPARTGLFDLAKRIRVMRRVVPAVAPDVAVGFMHSAFVPLAFALAGKGIAVVGSEHIVPGHYATRPVERLALVVGARLCDRITVVSEQAKAEFASGLARKMVVIPNPVGGAVQRERDRSSENSRVILNVGRLAEQKDQQTLISAFAEIASDHPDWRLRIIGEGELRGRLESCARQLGVAARVELPGASRNIWQEYRRAEIFALSSTYESFGLATAEALSAGVPAIGFADCPGTNELIRDGVNGLLVDSRNRVRGLAEALDRLIRRPDERAKLASQAPMSVERLTVREVGDRWENLFADLIGSPHQPPTGYSS